MRSTTFVFKVLSTFIQNSGVNCVQTEAQQNQTGRPRSASRHCVATPRPRLGVRTTHSPRSRRLRPPRPKAPAPRCASYLAARVSPRRRAVHAPRTGRTTGPTRASPYVRRSRRRCTTAASRPSSPRRHHRSTARPIKGARAFPRASTEPPGAIAALAPSSARSRTTESIHHLPTVPRPCRCSSTRALPSQESSPPNRAVAAAAAGHRRAPAPAAPPPQLRPSPGPR
jgi:hypothetical protein